MNSDDAANFNCFSVDDALARHWQNADSAVGVILTHGFTSVPGSMDYCATRLHKAGWETLSPCLPGHGTRWDDMARVTAEDWIACVEEAARRLRKNKQRVFLLGHSLGAALSLTVAGRHPNLCDGLILLNHATQLNPKIGWIVPWLRWMVPWVNAGRDIKDPAAKDLHYTRISLHGEQILIRAAAIARHEQKNVRCPVLILRSREDHVIPESAVHETLAKVAHCNPEIHWLENSYHVLPIDFDKDLAMTLTVDFVKRQTPL